MDRLLWKHKCAPSQAGKDQAQKFWKDEEKVMEHIEQCKNLQKSKVERGKDVICAVLVACFSHASKESKDTLVTKPILDLE